MRSLKVRVAGAVALAVGVVGFTAGGASASVAHHDPAPNLGPNVIVLSPDMPQATIQSTLDTIATQQVPNQFGTQRYAILFEPGTYGSGSDPLVFQIGYYTQVAGLGAEPGDVTINGAIDVFNDQCSTAPKTTCDGLVNFWRSLSNLTLNVTLPSTPPTYVPATNEDGSCNNSNDIWAVSQAAPMRRVIMNGTVSLQDYCNEGFVSGGFLADDEFNGGVVINAGQQQSFTRNSDIDGWTNGVWNQVFLGDNGAPATVFAPGTNQYTTVASTPVSEEEPFLYTDANGGYRVFVPAVERDSVGPSYASGSTPGTSIPIRRFFIANPSTPLFAINAALAFGQNLILTPGIYNLRGTIEVTRPDTVVLGLGFPTLVPENGNVSMQTASVPGIKLSGIIFDAGSRNSSALLEVGTRGRGAPWSHSANDPTLVQDVFFRIGGAEPGRATDSLVVNSDDTILDDVWAWRADHGAGVGWTSNRADTGVVVNGDDVLAYGLFVEHYQKFDVIWNGQSGEDVFFQNEMPYDPPSQSAWMSSPTTDGYAAFLVTPRVHTFQGYGMGSYSFFNQGVQIFATQAFQSPDRPGVQFNDVFTIFLNANGGSGGIDSVINGVGGSSTAANPDTPVDVVSYP
ncbi:MAG TPA: coagulation factor 5/8 type domain-containing protein [Solirubrobacteraceae bacterium]|nr:coagulation factor 5/8 type domain-containing protein [Solirubrobacteraceae bacterium]